ncbi:MAG: molybdopterin-guanine dinucleotide biosynthesis protein B [Deltaproteobacteria bacterium]|nr:molybdopterin-guanine dinucleotide biosynthesis protein B [Deltaproteobacteria bacterium]
MAAIITFIGWHDSGKNTLATQVVSHLKAFGYKVAVVKSSNERGVVFDTSGSDTGKHRQAGADSVLFVAPDQMVLQTKNSNLSLTTLAHRYFPDVDIIIGEGFTEARRISKIEVVLDKNQMLRNEVHGVIAVATNLDIAGEYVFRLDQAQEIAAFIRKRFLKDGRKTSSSVSLLVNGNNIPLKPFVQEVLAGTLVGFIDSLKFSADASEIDIRIKLDK